MADIPNPMAGPRPPWELLSQLSRQGREEIRRLAEAGKLTGEGKRIPLYRMKPEPPEDVA